MHLLLFDTAGIQPYIFRSNRLRENLGASYLVAQVTGRWVHDAAQHVAPDAILPENGRPGLEAVPKVRIEVIYTAGGNALVLCRDAGDAEHLVRHLSERVLRDAPGLRLLAAGMALDFQKDSLAAAVNGLFDELGRQKREAPPSEPLLGLGVTRACRATGLPAVGKAPKWGGEQPSFVSAEVRAKLNHVEQANRELREALDPGSHEGAALAFPTDLEDLGRSHGDTSLIAVVHADGDGMGVRFREIGRQYGRPEQNRAYVEAFRDLSRRVDGIARKALQQTLDVLRSRITSRQDARVIEHRNCEESRQSEHREDEGALIQRIELCRDEETGAFFLPVRPVISGGDDLTLVCDGRIGLALTTLYMEAFEREARQAGLVGVTASAGVALVKSHYPFARAYQLSEALARSAKKYRRELEAEVGCLDWHLSRTTLYDSLEAMRAREFDIRDGLLTLRPVALHPGADAPPARTWPAVAAGIAGFQGSAWHAKRNKAKRLRDALREGRDATAKVMNALNAAAPARQSGETVSLPPLPGVDASAVQTGWANVNGTHHALHFDALELSDLHIPLVDSPSADGTAA